MKILLTLFSPAPYLKLPQGILGWFGWLLLLGLVVFLLRKWRGYNKPLDRPAWNYLLLLILSVPITSLVIGIQLPAGSALPPPGVPVDPVGPAAMVFAALPWVLAGGLFGPTLGAVLALFSGILLAFWDTHSAFTPLELALLATLFSAAVRQCYRTRFFRFLRHPLLSASILAGLYPLISLTGMLLIAQGVLVNRLNYALTHISGISVAQAIELLVAGIFAEAIVVTLPQIWVGRSDFLPSPAERSLEARFLYSMAPLAVVLVLALMIGDWIVAGSAARGMLQARMANSAGVAAENLPYFIETGHSLISYLAMDPRLLTSDSEDLANVLVEDLRTLPYFRQIYVLDSSGSSISGYPQTFYNRIQAPLEEQKGIQLALAGLPIQSYAISPAEGESVAQVSFIAAIFDETKDVQGVLIGRSDLATNPFTQPILTSLRNLADIDGQGLLLDENQRILYHPDSSLVMTSYSGQAEDEPLFYEETGPDGTRRLIYYQRAIGHPWAVVLSVPSYRAQELALKIASPLLGMIMILTVLAVIVLRLGLRVVTGSLQTLSWEATRIAQGQLDNPLPVDGEDEVGHLRRAFEQMRSSLKARLDELNQLLQVSQGVASSLEIDEAIQPVLEATLAAGGSAARVILVPVVVPELDGKSSEPVAFGLGPKYELYKNLDEQILNLTRKQERIILSNPARTRLLSFTPGTPRPGALVAMALRHENLFYGALWLVYDRPHKFTQEEVRFIATLAGQAALAAANARLYLNSEIGRQRLASILASTPDPVLVTDQQDRLLLANPAAAQVLGFGNNSGEGQPIESIIPQKELLNLLRASAAEKQSAEVPLPDGSVFLATASSVLAEGQQVGRVCVLRDITYFKELDALKSEFVSTVSHDLRSPLTLMRGYATMLEMVGELNEQQGIYVRKIITGIESMSRLVNNLLDLGRIEAGIGLQLGMVSAQDIVEPIVGALQLEATQKRIQLATEFPEQIPQVEVDQALLQQALQNLVENAIKYTRAEGRVTVRLEVRHDRMVLEIIDTGIGISPMDQPRLFEKFYRGAQQASKDQRGTGLGLAIVKSIAERHGGQVWVESQLGKGSTFYLAVPLRQPKQEKEKD